MTVAPFEPLAQAQVPPLVAALPKADLHIHAEHRAALLAPLDTWETDPLR
jgi:hypothetical protein